MNLKRRLILGSLAAITMMALIAVLSYVLLNRMESSALTVIEEYDELRELDRLRTDLDEAKSALAEADYRPTAARESLGRARKSLEVFFKSKQAHEGAEARHNDAEAVTSHRLSTDLTQLILDVPDDAGGTEHARIGHRIDQIRSEVTTLGQGANELVDAALDRTHQQAAVANTTLVTLCVLGAASVLLMAYVQYRWVLQPVVTLRDRVRLAVDARRHDTTPVDSTDPVGDLGSGFDGLLAELNTLYGSLESRVNQKSRELVISERLASVGYLAAGVAHEINNPLNTILGYTELTLRDLSSCLDRQPSPGIETSIDSLRVVRDETMRCKHIVEKLLSLVRKTDAPREQVCIGQLIRDVVTIVDGLKQFRGRAIEIDLPEDSSGLQVSAREAELKQVLLNLFINAMDAVDENDGRVHIRAGRTDGAVFVEVSDNGHGMDEQTIQRIFEPFFTRKRGSSASGTGLGLSVVHAIVQDHGGEITAVSGGTGLGSTFTLKLPAAPDASRP